MIRTKTIFTWTDAEKDRRQQKLQDVLPYGKWTRAHGSEVLFNRHYMPIWERSPDGVVRPADHDEWVDYQHTEYFYFDGNAPRHNADTRERLNQLLKSWGVTS